MVEREGKYAKRGTCLFWLSSVTINVDGEMDLLTFP